MSLLEQIRDHGPSQSAVETNAEPSARANVRRPEEVLRIGGDELLLHAGRRIAPDGDVAAAVMVVVDHDEHLLAHEERRLAVRELFGRIGQRQYDLTHARD